MRRTTGSRDIIDRLFVYGTIRQGETARSLVEPSITRSVKASTTGQIYAFPMGYPGFVEGEGRVLGELLWLSQLGATFALLDAYEGTDFVRSLRQVTTEAGEDHWAWIYVLADPGAIKLGTRIADGDWVRYRNEQG